MSQKVADELKSKFANAIVNEQNAFGEITLTVDKAQLLSILQYIKETLQPGFQRLIDLTGVDYLDPYKHTKVVYLLQRPETNERLRIVVLVARQEPLPSITSLWRGADWYERELFDLFGVVFNDRPNIERILMPDDWQGHPLRKDYALTEESVEFKHGVKPKVPSEIIPYVKERTKF